MYGPSHWAVLAVFVAGSTLLVWVGRRQTEAQARLLGRLLGVLTVASYVAAAAYLAVHGMRAVPLHLTDLATFVAAYAFWSQRHWAYALTYYWGLVLSTQALISPALVGPDFPSVEYLGFWAIHVLVVWAAIYLTWGRGMRPTWRSYRLVLVVTAAWAVFTFTYNSITGTNYGFLNRKPSTASLLDVLGPWPVYVFTVTGLVVLVWALMTWPWERAARNRDGGS